MGFPLGCDVSVLSLVTRGPLITCLARCRLLSNPRNAGWMSTPAFFLGAQYKWQTVAMAARVMIRKKAEQ